MSKKKVNDVKDMTSWIEIQVNNFQMQKNVVNNNMPTIAILLTYDSKKIDELDNKDKKEYKKFIENNKEIIEQVSTLNPKAIGLGVGLTSLGVGALGGASGGLGVLGGLGALGGLGGIGAMGFGAIGLLNPIGLITGAGLASYSVYKILRKNRKNKEELQLIDKLESMQMAYEKKSQDNFKKFNENYTKMKELFVEKMGDYSKVVKENLHKMAINIDDFANTDVNKRIMQYQEIVLKQYKNQEIIQKELNSIIEAYNILCKENEELLKKIQFYENAKELCQSTGQFLM